MSIHSSLKTSGTMKRHRSVLSRLERVKILQEQGILTEGSSVLGLPKVKHLKIRVRKEKAVATPGTEATAAATPSEGQATAPAASPATTKPTGKSAPPAKPEAGASSKKKE